MNKNDRKLVKTYRRNQFFIECVNMISTRKNQYKGGHLYENKKI